MLESKHLSRSKIWLYVIALVGFSAPIVMLSLLGSVYYLDFMIIVFLYATIVVCWSMVLGYAGIFSFATLALFVLGGYASGIMCTRFELSPWITIILASVFTMGIGVAIGASLLRLRGFIVGLATFSFHFLLFAIVIHFADVTGGRDGLRMIPSLPWGVPLAPDQKMLADYMLAFAILLGTLILMRRFSLSMTGLAVRAYRDNENYATALGVFPAKLKLLVFALTALILGFAGGVNAHHLGLMAPEMLGLPVLVLLIASLTIGGVDNIYLACLSTIVLTGITEALRLVFPPGANVIILGAVIIVAILFPPSRFREVFERLETLSRST